jgi:predicted nucleic acid-binding protein
MSILLDTNILTRSIQLNHPMRPLAEDAVAILRGQNEQLCLVPQILYEFWVVCTRPTAQNGLGMSVAETAAEMVRLKAFFHLLDDTAAILTEWERLVTQYQVVGKSAHDARLVAALLVHGVPRILTFNEQNFRRYAAITAVSPQEVIQSTGP